MKGFFSKAKKGISEYRATRRLSEHRSGAGAGAGQAKSTAMETDANHLAVNPNDQESRIQTRNSAIGLYNVTEAPAILRNPEQTE